METKELSPRVTKYLYLLIAFCYLACHIDLGILAVSSDPIRHNLQITAAQMGLLASSIYLGNVAGSLIGPFLFEKLKAKHIIVVSAIMNGILVSAFNFTTNFSIILGSRVLAGLFQVMFVIYFPVWIDQHAPVSS
jgi:putative MFS transporter